MLYRPKPGPALWDTWLFPKDNRFHLFHLVRQGLSPVGGCDGIGHAVSDDLVHWEPRETIATLGPAGAWDAARTHTGMVVEREGRCVMFYGCTDHGVQRVGFMVSDDLEHWHKHPANPVMSPAGPHYQAEVGPLGEADWRDPFVVWAPQEQCYETFICARQAEWTAGGVGACVGRARSRDLTHWELLRPVAASDRFYHMEVPEHFEMAGRHYLIFSTTSLSGARLNTPTRERVSGTFYLMADDRLGPYRRPDDDLLLGSGEGWFDCYVGRTIEHEGQRLLYHHNCGSRPAFAAPKVIRQAPDGTLHLRYWPGMARLETGVMCEGFDAAVESASSSQLAEWSVSQGALRGQARCMDEPCLLPETVGDCHIKCRVTPEQCSRVTLLFRWDPEAKKGCALTLDYELGRVELGAAHGTAISAVRLQPYDKVRAVLPKAEPVELRVLARSEFVDAYLDDRWLFSAVLSDLPRAGRMGVAIAGGRATFDALRVAHLASET